MKFDNDGLYYVEGSTLNAIWNDVYMLLITDDGTPNMAIKGDHRRDVAQRLGALLEGRTFKSNLHKHGPNCPCTECT